MHEDERLSQLGAASLSKLFFRFEYVDRPWVVLALSFVLVAAFGFGLTGVVKEPAVDAFVPENHPAAVARDEASAVFGLEDPFVVALMSPEGASVFTPETLQAVWRITQAARAVDGVKRNNIVSLATESAIRGGEGELIVEAFIDEARARAGALDEADAAAAYERLSLMPMMQGALASASGDAVMILIPVDDPNHATDTFEAISALVAAETPDGVDAHISGVAAMNARLAHMVDNDTRIFVPAAVLTVLVIVFIALRRPTGLLGPLFVIAGSAAAGIGLMGWLGAKYYLITTALPVVIMAIAVADSLHISGAYMRLRRIAPALDAAGAVKQALHDTGPAVALTSLTTIAGFCGLAVGSDTRPIEEFAWFAAAGVAAAWLLSMTALPAIIVLTKLEPARAQAGHRGPVEHALFRVSAWSAREPAAALGVFAVVTAGLAILASGVEFDYERKRYFLPSDPVRQADIAINDRFAGSNFLDVIVEAPAAEGLLDMQAVAAMGRLQAEITDLPFVAKVTGLPDYISVMHGALTGAPAGAMPERARAPAQYMLLYETSGDPDDFKEEVDYEYRRALIRAHLDRDDYQQTAPTVARLEAIAAAWSEQAGLEARVSGRVAVNVGWMAALERSHFTGLALALVLVFLSCAAIFRRIGDALLAMTPVLSGVVLVYAVMGALDIDIAPATSMCAAISTGLGVDFGIHLLSHMRRRREAGASPAEAVDEKYISIARACLFSAVALAAGLSVVTLSSAPVLQWFGLLVAAGAVGSLLGALLAVPALSALIRPKLMEPANA